MLPTEDARELFRSEVLDNSADVLFFEEISNLSRMLEKGQREIIENIAKAMIAGEEIFINNETAK